MTSFESGLSTKQRSLFKRLELLCQRIPKIELPIRIEELWGFGSTIRGKEVPGDIDVVAKYSGFHPAYEAFKIITQAAIKKYGWENDRPETPREAVVLLMASLPDDLAKNKTLFASWLEGVTWGIVFKDMTPSMYGWDWQNITSRILHRGIRQIHVMQYALIGDKAYLAAKAYQLFWSRDKPDLYANLQVAFSSEEIRKSCLTELHNFETQLAPLKLELEIVGHIFPQLLKHDGTFKSFDDCTMWLVEQAIKSFPRYPEEIIKQILHRGETSKELPIPDMPLDAPLDTLKELVESKRKEVKRCQQELKVLNIAIWTIKDLKTRLPEITGSEFEEWIALRTIEEVPKYFVGEDKIREHLRKLGLPEQRIETVKRKGCKTHYRIKKDSKLLD